MKRSLLLPTIICSTGAVLAAAAPASAAPASAPVATPAPAPAPAAAPAPARVDVIATGLDSPRGLIVTRDGTVLVTEAGRGGSGPCITAGEGEKYCLGATGAVTAVRHGHQYRAVTGLPSLFAAGSGQALGPADITISGSRVLVSIGLGALAADRATLGTAGALTGQIVRLGRHGPTALADLAGYEADNNPDRNDPGSGTDSDPYGLAPDHRGGAIATDAGGNDLLRVDRSGRISTLAVFHPRMEPNPMGGPDVPMQSVPTTVVRGPDGAYYVGELTGFPFVPGAARVLRVVPGHEPTVYATGFTNIIDIAFDHNGRLLVLEIAKNGLLSNDLTGGLIRVGRHGERTDLGAGAGLFAPSSVAVGDDDALYVSNKGVVTGGGEVLRIRPAT